MNYNDWHTIVSTTFAGSLFSLSNIDIVHFQSARFLLRLPAIFYIARSVRRHSDDAMLADADAARFHAAAAGSFANNAYCLSSVILQHLAKGWMPMLGASRAFANRLRGDDIAHYDTCNDDNAYRAVSKAYCRHTCLASVSHFTFIFAAAIGFGSRARPMGFTV